MPSDEKVTVMILEVDLKCSCCYKKVRKLLCKFPQIRDQVFDEDKNKVMITVVCCDPEKLRDKLCCKGGRAIQSIEIVEKPKPPPPKPAESKPKEPEKPKQTPPQPQPEKPKPLENKPSGKSDPKPNPPPKQPDPLPMPPVVQKPQPQPQPPPVKMPDPMPPQPKPQPQPEPINMPMPYPTPMDGYPFCPPVSTCCQECSQGLGGGPCHYGYGRPVPPPPGPCYDGYPYGGSRPCYVRCDYYFSEENPQGCSIM